MAMELTTAKVGGSHHGGASIRSLGSLASVEDLKSGRQTLTSYLVMSALVGAIGGILFGFDQNGESIARHFHPLILADKRPSSLTHQRTTPLTPNPSIASRSRQHDRVRRHTDNRMWWNFHHSIW